MWWYGMKSLYHAVIVPHLGNRYFLICLCPIASFAVVQVFLLLYKKNREMIVL